ncbi:MAG: phosphodiester glycosidase family protein [Chloracidobacterium sp.]|nr:phosphodiester glycosidase family protein [Chloracidobacterium sp.]
MTAKEHPTMIRFAQVLRLVSILCVLCARCGSSLAQDFKQVHPGVEYAQVEHKLGDDPVKINLLRLDLTRVRLDVHHALDKAIGLETTSSIATRKGAVAAINAGFFRLDKGEWAGDASELLMVDGRLLSDSVNQRVALSIVNTNKRTSVDIGQLKVDVGLLNDDGLISLNFDVNRERKMGSFVIYTPEFGTKTLTDDNGVEVIVRPSNGTRTSALELKDGIGNTRIPNDGFVVSLTGKISIEAEYLHSMFYRKQRVRFAPVFSRGNLSITPRIEDAVAGVPQLIKNGKIDITWEQEKASRAFVETRHPRTAVAKLKDGKFLMMTVDGRQPGVSVGMSLQELAEYLVSLGAVDAMNLDGGGSTTMFLDGKVVNKPSDPTGERKIGDAIVVTLRNKPAARK